MRNIAGRVVHLIHYAHCRSPYSGKIVQRWPNTVSMNETCIRSLCSHASQHEFEPTVAPAPWDAKTWKVRCQIHCANTFSSIDLTAPVSGVAQHQRDQLRLQHAPFLQPIPYRQHFVIAITLQRSKVSKIHVRKMGGRALIL